MGNRLLLLGGGGHCRSVLDTIKSLRQYAEIAIIAPDAGETDGIKVIGTDEDVPGLYEAGWRDAFITLGSVGDTRIRRRLYEMIDNLGFNIPSFIDPSAILAEGVKIGRGCFVGKRAVINAGCTIGNCAIINTAAVIEHDCVAGDFTHVSPGAVLCGDVKLADDVHVGAGAVVKQGVRIQNGTMVGMGSVVLTDLPQKATAYGNPCRVQGDRVTD